VISRRDKGFSIFYIGTNLGSLLPLIVIGLVVGKTGDGMLVLFSYELQWSLGPSALFMGTKYLTRWVILKYKKKNTG
jgi:dipeptide/tripeptide permease